MLHDYLSTILPRDPNPTLPLKSWHGAPMASLRRTFQVYGDPLSGAISAEQRELLRNLQDLYMRPTPTRLEDNIEEEGIGINIVDEEAGTGIRPGRDDLSTGNVQTGSSAMPTTTSHHDLGARSVRTAPSRDDRDMVAKWAINNATDTMLQNTIFPHTVEDQRCRKRCRGSSGDQDLADCLDDFPSTISKKRVIPNKEWKWGPYSSSLNKSTWFPAMMGWNGAKVGE